MLLGRCTDLEQRHPGPTSLVLGGPIGCRHGADHADMSVTYSCQCLRKGLIEGVDAPFEGTPPCGYDYDLHDVSYLA